MDYIIINSVNSNTIKGLLIQLLPPISKPKIRFKTEEIDGRDGDLVTKLGYSAYDKELSIGLHDNFDINEVINFFNSEGSIIFSDEPDKYYKFQILQQIDFEKLIRFKTAIVRIHIQPFKYSVTQQTLTTQTSSIVVNNTGNTVSKPVFKVYGTGNISIYLNNIQIFTVALGNEGNITIDIAKMEAYKDNVLKNRLVTGNYENFVLQPGNNTIRFSGGVTKFEISDYSRWI